MVQLELRDESPRWARQSADVGRREDQYGRGQQRAARRPECDLFQASSPKNDAKLVVLIMVVLSRVTKGCHWRVSEDLPLALHRVLERRGKAAVAQETARCPRIAAIVGGVAARAKQQDVV